MTTHQNFLNSISSLSIKRYRIVYLGMIFLISLGMYYYMVLPRESKPEVVFPLVKINVTFPGATPQDVETLVTNKLEAAFSGIEGIEFMTSSSLAGRAELQINFYPEEDIDKKLDELDQAIRSVKDLPDEAEEPSVRVSTTANRAFMVVSLSGDISATELKASSDILENRLLSVQGVNEVKVSGSLVPEIRIVYNPARLAEFNLSVEDLVQAVRIRHKDTPAGDAVLDDLHHYVRVLGSYRNVEEIRKTVINLPGGGSRFLKDLAVVEETYEPRISYSRRAVGLGGDTPVMKSAITLSLYRNGGTDIIGPSSEVRKILSDKAGTGLPAELDILVIQDDAVNVREDLNDVLANAASGLVIVIIVLFLFLGIRESIITALIIPFSMFIAFMALNAAGMTFNTMTLLAMIIALGLLVDNAIVVVENVVMFREKGFSRLKAAKEGTAEVAPSILAATMTTMAAFIPLAFMGGRVGMIISVIPVTILFIIGASLLIALTITPALSSRFLAKKTGNHKAVPFSIFRETVSGLLIVILVAASFMTDGKPGLLSFVMALIMGFFMIFRSYSRYRGINAFERVSGAYKKLLDLFLVKRLTRILVPSLMGLLFLCVLMAIPLGLLKIELFPIRDESTLYVHLYTPEFSSLEYTNDYTGKAENLLLKVEGIESMYSEVGLTSFRDAQIVMNLSADRSWSTQEMLPVIMKDLSTVPGGKLTVGTSPGGKTANSPVQIVLSGYSLESLEAVSLEMTGILSGMDDIRNPVTDFEQGYPEVEILPRSLVSSDLGIDASSIGNTVRTFLSGQTVGTLLSDEGEQDIRFTTIPSKTDSVDDLEKILVKLKDGTRVPLTHVATLAPTKGWGTIRHSDGRRTVTILAQLVPGANIREVVKQFDTQASELTLPDGIDYKWAGEAADLDSSLNEMSLNFVLALLVVFIILAIQFDSLTQPLVILVSVPMSVIGVFIGLLLTGNNFGLYAFMGVIALVGIVVNDAIVLVDTINRNRSIGLSLRESLTEAGRTRFGPVLATSLTTIGGMLPLAFKDANFAQLSISLISGLLASTILTLLVLPIIYNLVETSKVRIQKVIPLFIDDIDENEVKELNV